MVERSLDTPRGRESRAPAREAGGEMKGGVSLFVQSYGDWDARAA
jgi:hypothetical protein